MTAAAAAAKVEETPEAGAHAAPAAVALGADPACIRCNFAGFRHGRPICRRNAPAVGAGGSEERLWAVWPIVGEEDWCGEFRPSETLFGEASVSDGNALARSASGRSAGGQADG